MLDQGGKEDGSMPLWTTLKGAYATQHLLHRSSVALGQGSNSSFFMVYQYGAESGSFSLPLSFLPSHVYVCVYVWKP